MNEESIGEKQELRGQQSVSCRPCIENPAWNLFFRSWTNEGMCGVETEGQGQFSQHFTKIHQDSNYPENNRERSRKPRMGGQYTEL